MELLDYVEDQGRRNAVFSLETLELMSKRAHTLLTLLLGGAGASGTVALAQLGPAGVRWVLWPLAAVSVWWFALAAWVAVKGLRTREVRAPAGAPGALLKHFEALRHYSRSAAMEGAQDMDALEELRRDELATLDETAKAYRQASSTVAAALDAAYVGAAATPLWAFGALVVARML